MALLYAYSFDEASGNVIDASGNGRDVTLAAPLARTTGHTNSGMTSSSAAGQSNGPALTGLQTANCTLMCWIKRTDNSQIGWIGELKSGGSGNRGLLVGLSGQAAFRCRNSSNTAATPGAAQPAVGTWYHLAGTWDGTTVRVFINGSQVASAALSGAPHTGATSSSVFDTIGAETIIDDLRYYDTALSAAQITTLMGQPVTAAGTDVPGTLVATLGAPTATALGVRATSGTATASLPPVVATMTGLRDGHGSGAALLSGPVGSLTGQRSVSGSFDVTLPGPAAEIHAAVEVGGTAEALLPGTTATLAGLRDGHGSGAAILPAPVASLTGSVTDAPLLSALLPAPVSTLVGLPEAHGAGAAALPGPVGLGTGHRSTQGVAVVVLGAVLAAIDTHDVPVPVDEGADWLTLEDMMAARADQESIQLDVITIRHDEHSEDDFDPAKGYAPTTMPEPFYGPGIAPHNGKARVQARPVQSGERDVVGQSVTVLGYAVAIPWDVVGVRPTDIIEIVSSTYEPAHAGKTLRVADVQSSTFVTARRMSCVDYQKQAS